MGDEVKGKFKGMPPQIIQPHTSASGHSVMQE